MLDKLERKLGWLAIPNLTLFLIFGQIIVYVLASLSGVARSGSGGILDIIALVPDLVYAGEVWRVVTFVFSPPLSHPIFVALAWYFFYLMGSALEGYWGDFRYTVFLGIGWVMTVTLAMAWSLLFPGYNAAFTTAFLGGSVFLAFAHLNPDFTVLLFFVLPVRIKWLALLAWLSYLYVFLFGAWPAKITAFASIVNYLCFFWRDLYLQARVGHRTMGRSAHEFKNSQKAIHCCRICGATEKTRPDYEFRYCSKCSRKACYCMQHLQEHEHI